MRWNWIHCIVGRYVVYNFIEQGKASTPSTLGCLIHGGGWKPPKETNKRGALNNGGGSEIQVHCNGLSFEQNFV